MVPTPPCAPALGHHFGNGSPHLHQLPPEIIPFALEPWQSQGTAAALLLTAIRLGPVRRQSNLPHGCGGAPLSTCHIQLQIAVAGGGSGGRHGLPGQGRPTQIGMDDHSRGVEHPPGARLGQGAQPGLHPLPQFLGQGHFLASGQDSLAGGFQLGLQSALDLGAAVPGQEFRPGGAVQEIAHLGQLAQQILHSKPLLTNSGSTMGIIIYIYRTVEEAWGRFFCFQTTAPPHRPPAATAFANSKPAPMRGFCILMRL